MEDQTALAVANTTAIIALAWHLEKAGRLDGNAYRATLETTAQSMAADTPELARFIRDIAAQTKTGFTQDAPGWLPEVIEGGLKDASLTA